MACSDCGPQFQGQCDCCKLVNGDESFKLVYECKTCGAYLCADCDGKLFKRGVAMVIDKTHKLFAYYEKIKNKITQ